MPSFSWWRLQPFEIRLALDDERDGGFAGNKYGGSRSLDE
jgi:hypothetical protein